MASMLKEYLLDAEYKDLDETSPFKGFCHDTRHLKQGEIFLCLKGSFCHGSSYAAEAYLKGALAVMVDHEHARLVRGPKIIVHDVMQAAYLAASLKRKFYTHQITAITGTAGKTTAKDYLAQLAYPQHIYVSFANWNNMLGLIVNLSRFPLESKHAVFELGISETGEMTELVDLLQPQIAVIVTIGAGHLEGLGSVEKIATEKQKITKYARVLITTMQAYPFLDKKKDWIIVDRHYRNHETTFNDEGMLKHKLILEETLYQVTSTGLFFPSQFLLALSILSYQGYNFSAHRKSFHLKTPRGRGTFYVCREHILIDDTYNANLVSLKGLITQIKSFSAPALIVLGDFAELGVATMELLKQFFLSIEISSHIEYVYFGKDRMRMQSLGLKTFDNAHLLLQYIKWKNPKFIALKGSRINKLELLLQELVSLLQEPSSSVGILGQGLTGQSIIAHLTQSMTPYKIWDQQFIDCYEHESQLKTWIHDHQTLMISPGVCPHQSPYNLIPLKKVLTDLDYFFLKVKTKNIILITGTNGKTSLVELMVGILQAHGYKAWGCGNNECPPLNILDRIQSQDWVVCELSSFQLYWMRSVPVAIVAAVTSFDQDHLNWHQSLDEYHVCKERILQFAQFKFAPESFTALKDYEIWDKSFLADSSASHLVDHGVVITKLNESLYSSPLRHPLHQAYQISQVLSLNHDLVIQYLQSWQSSNHRFQRLIHNGVLWINDTKATNIEASFAALSMLQNHKQRIYVILGGEAKGQNLKSLKKFIPLAEKFFIIGKNPQDFAAILKDKAIVAQTLKDFFELLKNYPKPGIVLLSLACASLDQFKNYKERGELFFKIVHQINGFNLENTASS